MDLSGNWARTKGAQALTKAIRNSSFHFRELILRDNQIVESGVVGLVLQGFGKSSLPTRGQRTRALMRHFRGCSPAWMCDMLWNEQKDLGHFKRNPPNNIE